MSEKKPTWKRLLQTFAVLAILVIFPLGSWYFLQKGLDYTKDKYERLDSLGQIQWDTLSLRGDEELTAQALEGRLTLAGSLKDANARELSVIEGLWKKFDGRKDFLFLFYDNDSTAYTDRTLFMEYDFTTDDQQVKIVNQSSGTASDFFKLFQVQSPLKPNELILIDTKGFVRGRYDILNEEQRDLMISHIVFLLPKD